MRNKFSHRFAVCSLGVFVAILSGCASSPPSRFYQLGAAGGHTSDTHYATNQESMVVAIGPIRIPDYLDRPQIVTRSGKNELDLSEFNRWTGSLEDDIVRVLAENISAFLPSERFYVVRWTPFLDSQLTSSYKVQMLLDRFEGTFGGEVSLRAQWAIFGKDKRLLLKKQTDISEQVNGKSYEALVEAMSKAVERLSREISDGIVSAGSTGPT